jgi:hypothetical protein
VNPRVVARVAVVVVVELYGERGEGDHGKGALRAAQRALGILGVRVGNLSIIDPLCLPRPSSPPSQTIGKKKYEQRSLTNLNIKHRCQRVGC